MLRTISPGTLVVQSAYPDPPFDLMMNGAATGFDIELMRAISNRLGLKLRAVAYEGDNFNNIFDGLIRGTCDAVISGATITPERAAIVKFSSPYLVFNQGVAVNKRRTPNVKSIRDLRGLTAGIQSGNTSDLVARKLLAQGDIADIRYYPYHGIMTAIEDLEAGRIGLIIKLFPVITWLIREQPDLTVIAQEPTRERLGIAFAPARADLCEAVDAAIRELRASGEFVKLQANWPGTEASLPTSS
jgi:polar amino acid transport system substrate-binding protein